MAYRSYSFISKSSDSSSKHAVWFVVNKTNGLEMPYQNYEIAKKVWERKSEAFELIARVYDFNGFDLKDGLNRCLLDSNFDLVFVSRNYEDDVCAMAALNNVNLDDVLSYTWSEKETYVGTLFSIKKDTAAYSNFVLQTTSKKNAEITLCELNKVLASYQESKQKQLV